MKIKLIQVGKTDEKHIEDGVSIYLSRLKHYIPFEVITVPASKAKTSAEAKKEESIGILSKVQPGEPVILLDEKGDEYSSVEFSKFLQKKMNSGVKAITFVIGGAYGFSDDVYKIAERKVALSKMTFSHQMVRLFFTEQLYRALTILKGERYHHE